MDPMKLHGISYIDMGVAGFLDLSPSFHSSTVSPASTNLLIIYVM